MSADTTSKGEDFRDIQRRFTQHLRNPAKHPAPDGIEDRRLAIYRRLVFGNIRSLLSSRFPVIKALLGEDGWNNTMRDFLINHRASIPLFPEMGQEFVAYIEQHRNNDSDLPFLLELAHYEFTSQTLSNSAIDLNEADANRDGDILQGIPIFSPLAWVLGYSWPVHRIRPEYRPTEKPEAATWLIVYRDRRNQRSFMELKPATARLCQLLQENQILSGGELVAQFAADLGRAEDNNVIAAGEQQLHTLRRKGILLGTK